MNENWKNLNVKYFEMEKDLKEISRKIGRPYIEIFAILDVINEKLGRQYIEKFGQVPNKQDIHETIHYLKTRQIGVTEEFLRHIFNLLFK